MKKEEVETKVSAWQTAEVAKINNRFKREEVVINGWETEQVEKASAWLKKIEVLKLKQSLSLIHFSSLKPWFQSLKKQIVDAICVNSFSISDEHMQSMIFAA